LQVLNVVKNTIDQPLQRHDDTGICPIKPLAQNTITVKITWSVKYQKISRAQKHSPKKMENKNRQTKNNNSNKI
jgi:hypothetical protein